VLDIASQDRLELRETTRGTPVALRGRMKIGSILLSIWSGFNLVLALGITLALLVFERNAPALSILFEGGEIARLDPRALATVNALAVLCNAVIAAFCALVLMVTWKARRQTWAFFALAGTMVFVQACGFASDARLGHRNLIANVISTGILVVGLSFADRERRLSS
jgi:hypothetical protein